MLFRKAPVFAGCLRVFDGQKASAGRRQGRIRHFHDLGAIPRTLERSHDKETSDTVKETPSRVMNDPGWQEIEAAARFNGADRREC